MKWFKRTARESVGFCRGAAIDYSPGLQPWVSQTETRALKVAPDVSVTGGVNTPCPEHTRRSPLSGRFIASPHPALKPWAILYNRFAVNPPDTLAKALGCSVGPFHGQELLASVNFLKWGDR
ncbi:MAG TPA: hypothetical protein VE641_01680 [Chthoniobacterales bacterium]|nr:hypothetical protein [Chthoniobacterales bacterium]